MTTSLPTRSSQPRDVRLAPVLSRTLPRRLLPGTLTASEAEAVGQARHRRGIAPLIVPGRHRAAGLAR